MRYDLVLLSYSYSSMKKKTSISVSEKLLEMIDSLPDHPPRSVIIAESFIAYLKATRTTPKI